MPKIKCISLAFTTILTLAFAWNTSVELFYTLFILGSSILILSFLSFVTFKAKLKLARTVQDIAYEDDLINVGIDISSKKILPSYSVEIIDHFKGESPGQTEKSMFLSKLKGMGSRKISYVTECYKRGLWDFGPIVVSSQDFLGFFESKKKHKVFSKILVYPKLFNVLTFPEPKSSSLSWMGVETAKISGDSHEFFGVREYQRGDLKSRIHWPLTAKHNKLITKEFQRSAAQEVTIILDLEKDHDIGIGRDSTLEYSVKIAGSIAKYLLDKGVFIQLIGHSKERDILPFGKGESHMHRILEYLAMVTSAEGLKLSHVLDEAIFFTPNQSTLVTMVLDNDLEAISNLFQYKIKGIKLILFVFSVETFGVIHETEKKHVTEFEDTLVNLEAETYRISKDDNLEEKLQAK
ncbi:MAG: DUF58 domain-containing protein [Candidatus Omnitrophota bacterium]